MKIGELAVDIKIKGGTQSVATMKQLKTTALATKTAMLAMVVAFAKMSQEARKFAMNMAIFEANTGLSAQTLQKMSFMAAQAGVSLDNLAGTLQNIQSMTKQIALGEGNLRPFTMLGISPYQDPVKIINQIGAAIRRNQKDPAMLRQIIDDFGISNELYYALLQGQTEELEEQYILKKEDQEALVALNKEWYKLWWYVKQIGIRSQGFLAHVALPLLKAMTNLAKFAGELVIGFGEIAQKSASVEKAIAGIGIVVAGILAYMFPITAGMIAIALICEDIYGYFSGKDSITGRMEQWINSGQILKDVFMTIWEILRSISKFFFGAKTTKRIFDFMEGRDESGAKVTSWEERMKGLLPDFTDFASLGLAGAAGGMSVTQYNTANFVARNAQEDAQTAGGMFSEAAVDDTALQNPDVSRGE